MYNIKKIKKNLRRGYTWVVPLDNVSSERFEPALNWRFFPGSTARFKLFNFGLRLQKHRDLNIRNLGQVFKLVKYIKLMNLGF